MQRITYPENPIHPIFSDLAHLYQRLSVRKTENNGVLFEKRVNACLKPIITLFERYSDLQSDIQYAEGSYQPMKLPRSTKKILLAFSGGKDSTATAIWLKDHGYKVTLYHLRGINQTYKDEYINAQRVADALHLPLVVEQMKVAGSHEWIEHPMKNMILASSMLQYGIRTGLTAKIAFGNFSTSTLASDPFEVCGGDCKEAWRAFERALSPVLNVSVMTPLSCMKETLDILMGHPDIAVLCQSCIGPFRYRDYLNRNNVEKYGLQDLPEKRCWSCWKCCLEYCVYTDNGIYRYDKAFYKHCLQILQKTLLKEVGLKCTIQETWDHYFFYERGESKFFQEVG